MWCPEFETRQHLWPYTDSTKKNLFYILWSRLGKLSTVLGLIPSISVILFSLHVKVTFIILILSKKCTLYLCLTTEKIIVIFTNRLLPAVSSQLETRKTEHKLKHKKFCLNMKPFSLSFSARVTEQWNSFPRDAVETPSLETGKTQLYTAPSSPF